MLEEAARRLTDDVWIIAPAEEQSGAGHSLTLNRPVRLREHGERHYSVTGTPTDAVMLALAHVMKDNRPTSYCQESTGAPIQPKMLLIPGTVSAAMEGALAGVRSIALSQAYSREGMGDTVPFAAAEAWAERVLAPLVEQQCDPSILLNVNFPALKPEEVKGIRMCRQGLRDYGRLRIIQGKDSRGYDYYWFGLGPIVHTPSHSTDLEAIANGYVSVTPLHMDLTDDASIPELQEYFSAQYQAAQNRSVSGCRINCGYPSSAASGVAIDLAGRRLKIQANGNILITASSMTGFPR